MALKQSVVAKYECQCGNQVVLYDDGMYNNELDLVRSVMRKFGYTNASDVFGALEQCCGRPEYVDVSSITSLGES